MLQVHLLRLFCSALLIFCATALAGCGSKDVPAKTDFTDKEKQQIQEYKKQATDEWGKPIK